MLFEDWDKLKMAPQKEAQFTVRLDDETYEWFLHEAAEAEMTRADFVRVSMLVAAAQIKNIPALRDIQLKDILPADK